VGAERRILDRCRRVHDDEAGGSAVGLAAEHTAHALDHLTAAAACRDDDGEVGGRDVDAFVENLRGSDDMQVPSSESSEDGATASGIELRVDRRSRQSEPTQLLSGLLRPGDARMCYK